MYLSINSSSCCASLGAGKAYAAANEPSVVCLHVITSLTHCFYVILENVWFIRTEEDYTKLIPFSCMQPLVIFEIAGTSKQLETSMKSSMTFYGFPSFIAAILIKVNTYPKQWHYNLSKLSLIRGSHQVRNNKSIRYTRNAQRVIIKHVKFNMS